MNKLNGIVLDGKFYEAKKSVIDCDKCDLRGENCEVALCTYFDAHTADIHIFRLNKKVTQKLNDEKPTKFRRK